MQLIITVSAWRAGSQIRIDGWLAGDGVAELEQTVASAPGPVRLLVRELRGADAEGLSVLHRLDREGLALDGLSPYLRLMLDRASDPLSASALAVTRSETPVRSDNT